MEFWFEHAAVVAHTWGHTRPTRARQRCLGMPVASGRFDVQNWAKMGGFGTLNVPWASKGVGQGTAVTVLFYESGRILRRMGSRAQNSSGNQAQWPSGRSMGVINYGNALGLISQISACDPRTTSGGQRRFWV